MCLRIKPQPIFGFKYCTLFLLTSGEAYSVHRLSLAFSHMRVLIENVKIVTYKLIFSLLWKKHVL